MLNNEQYVCVCVGQELSIEGIYVNIFVNETRIDRESPNIGLLGRENPTNETKRKP